MSSADRIVTQLEDLSVEVSSEKVTVRNKAIDQIANLILEGQGREVVSILTGETRSTFCPKYVFNNVFQGMLKHASRQEQTQTQRTDNKASTYILVIQHLLDSCNQLESNRIPTSLIFDSLSSIFESDFFGRQYGTKFLNITYRYLKSNNPDNYSSNFANIDKGKWRRLLDGCRNVCEGSSRNLAIPTMALILRLGSSSSYLEDVLVDFTPRVESLFDDAEKCGDLNEVLQLSCDLTKILCVTYQKEMCLFSERACHFLLKSYKTNLKDDFKSNLFEYLYLMLVIHEPKNSGAASANSNSTWTSIKRSIESVVEAELNFLNEYKLTRDLDILSNSLLSCAGYLYYLILKLSVAQPNNNDDDADVVEILPSNEKRQRTSSEFEKLLSKIHPSDKKFVWRWFVVLGSTINNCPRISLSSSEIESLIKLCSSSIDLLTYEVQFKALRSICNYLLNTPEKRSINWMEITQGIFKLHLKYQSKHSVELLQFILEHQLCTPKLLQEIFNHITSSPSDAVNIRSLYLLCRTREFKEIIGGPQVEKDLIMNYLNSNGQLVLFRNNFDQAIDLLLILLNIPEGHQRKSAMKYQTFNDYDDSFIEIMRNIGAKTLKSLEKKYPVPVTTEKFFPPNIRPEDLNQSLMKRLFKTIFFETEDAENQLSSVVILMLRQLEFTTRFMQRLSAVLDISKAGDLLSGVFGNFGENLKGLTKAFKSQISEEETVVVKILDCLRDLLSVEYVKELKPILTSSGFLLQAVIWTHHQYESMEDENTESQQSTQGRSLNRSQAEKNNRVIENIIRMGSIQEGILKEYWIEGSCIPSAIIMDIPKMSRNKTLVKVLLKHLDELVTKNVKHEPSNIQFLEQLTSLLVVFKEVPTTIADMDKFVTRYIRWGCKTHYSVELAIKLLDFYERFFEIFIEHREFNPEFVGIITESLSRFIVSKNFRIQMRTVELLVKICGTNEIWEVENRPFATSIAYCHFVCNVATNLKLNDLLELDSPSDGDNRCGVQQEIENQSTIVHHLICGLALKNESISGIFLNFLVTFYGRNRSLKRDIGKLPVQRIVEENLMFLIGSWLEKELPIETFPFFLTGCSTFEQFGKKFHRELGLNFILRRPWKDFVELNQKFQWPEYLEDLWKTLLIFQLIPEHPLNSCGNFKKNLHNLNNKRSVNLHELPTTVLVTLLHSLHSFYSDEKTFEEYYNFSLPSIEGVADSFAISETNYSQALKSLNAINPRTSLINSICSKRPDEVLLILSDFQEKIFVASNLFGKLKNLQKFLKFSHLTMEFIVGASLNTQMDFYKNYFVKDIVLFLVHFVRKEKIIPNVIKIRVLNLLLEIIKRTVSHCQQMFADNLNRIIAELADLAMENREDSTLCDCIAELIKYFMESCKRIFSDTLGIVDILPEDHLSFEYVSTIQVVYAKETIGEEIERFLAVPKRGIYSLKYIRRKIQENEKEFIELFQALKQDLRNVPNTSNLAHRLVSALLRYIKDEKEEIRIEASKILGDLGPVDLNTMILSSDLYKKDLPKAFDTESTALMYFLPSLIDSLQDLHYQFKSNVSTLVLKALSEIVHQPEAENLLKSQPDLYLFKQSSGPVKNLFEIASKASELEMLSGFTVSPFLTLTVDEWIQRNALSMLTFLNNQCLFKVVEKDVSFGRKLFPLLLSTILAMENDLTNRALEETINNFFKDFELAREKKTTDESNPSLILNEDLLKFIITLVELIRIYNHSAAEKVNLNYLSIASAAQYCNLHGNAILYGELWVEEEKLTRKCSENELTMTELRPIMIPSYEALEVNDAVKPFLDLNQSRHKYYLLENAWEFAYLESTTELSSKRCSTSHESSSYHSNSRLSSSQFSESSQMNYESIWRLGDWDQLRSIGMANAKCVLSDEFQRNHCLALNSLHIGDEWRAKLFLHSARDLVISRLAQSSLDCTKGVYESMTALKQIRQLEDVLTETKDWKAILAKWLRFDGPQTNSFEQQEQILVQRISILQSKSGRSASHVQKQMFGTVLELIKLAKEERNFKAAITNLKNLESLELDTETKSRMILEDGHLQFIAGHSKLANHLYLRLINETEFQETFSKISALRLMAEYLTDNPMVSPREILQNYLLEAEKLYKSYRQAATSRSVSGKVVVEEGVKIFDTTAKFADTIYTQRNNYMKSSDYAEKGSLHRESVAELKQMGKTNLSKADQLRAHNLRQTINLEAMQLKSVASEREKYLRLAIQMYTKSCMVNEGLNDLQICRIVSLWFTNISDQSIGEFLQGHLPKVPSYKFLLILPQIAARLSHSDEVSTKTISEALIRCCQQHPHQSIYHVLALYNAHEDNATAVVSASMKTRLVNTKLIVKKLMQDATVGPIVAAAQHLSLALIKLANKEVQERDTKVGRELLSLGDMYRIAAPTVELPVKINLKYSNQFPYITNWVPNFQMVGGINAPKKLTFRCSDGISRSMLVKGKDDLRQDAVMQQVFQFMNILLKTKRSSCQRNLAIRTYKIVPLTQMSGILEFCDNTTTLGNYLVTAHEKYRPDDMKISECRQLMANCAKKTPEEKLAQFEIVCKKLSPVFQHFFTENFFSPVEWFEKRMFYTNSVATTSMVGYIMGIGDRHVNNILIDKTTAEVIHIDFGIALERGKLLPTPERVPFRLSRDLVAAMGCFGVDGLFRKSCEITMEVLRENKALINTIVEVFLYDPLYTWTSSKKTSTNDQNDDEKNALAARVLIRVNEKLNGRDENDTTAIENQVARLISQAMSPFNISQMFSGWQGYL